MRHPVAQRTAGTASLEQAAHLADESPASSHEVAEVGDTASEIGSAAKPSRSPTVAPEQLNGAYSQVLACGLQTPWLENLLGTQFGASESPKEEEAPRLTLTQQPFAEWPKPVCDPPVWADVIGLEEYQVPPSLMVDLQSIEPHDPIDYQETPVPRIHAILASAIDAAMLRAFTWVKQTFGISAEMEPARPRLKIGHITHDGDFVPLVPDSSGRRKDESHTPSLEAVQQRRRRLEHGFPVVYGIMTDGQRFWIMRKTPGFEGTMLTPNAFEPFDWAIEGDRGLLYSFLAMMMRDIIHTTREEFPQYLPQAHPAPLGNKWSEAKLKKLLWYLAEHDSPQEESKTVSERMQRAGLQKADQVGSSEPVADQKMIRSMPLSAQCASSSLCTPMDRVFSGGLGQTRSDTPSVLELDPTQPSQGGRPADKPANGPAGASASGTSGSLADQPAGTSKFKDRQKQDPHQPSERGCDGGN
ncbi:hypothetical protein KEM52_006079 [Ascosphaera acerosa]|nr:hypothetical protein KEM52_006079 [Ascosphaera acerosa]